jgi:uncharacterized protein (TIGR00369 family)
MIKICDGKSKGSNPIVLILPLQLSMQNDIYYRLKLLEGQYMTETKSKAGKWLNYKLDLVEPGYVEVSLEVKEDMTNPVGNLHGGMSAMICDEICGLAFYSLGMETYYTTVNLMIDYLYSAPLGSRIKATGKVLRAGKRISNTECYIYNEKGVILVHAKSNLVNTGNPVFELT